MLNTDRDAVICDLAETYHLYDYRSLPPTMVATLVVGLRNDSRIKLKISGQKVATETLLSAIIADRLGTLVWFKTEDGQSGRNRPESIYSALTGNEIEKDFATFESPEDFEEAWNKICQQHQ